MAKRRRGRGLGTFESLERRAMLTGDLAGSFGDSLERLTDTGVGASGGTNTELRISSLTENSGEVFYTANGANGSLELWKSDGTSSGTERVRAGVSNYAASTPGLTTIGDTMYFTVQHNDGDLFSAEGDYELWKSDGTEAGTQRVIKLADWSQEGQVSTQILDAGDGRLLIVVETSSFSATTAQFWVSDGTTEGTHATGPRFKANFTAAIGQTPELNGQRIFNGVDTQPDSSDPRYGIWTVDSAAETLTMLREFEGDEFNGAPGPYGLVLSRTQVMFGANDGATGNELWRTDGTEHGTILVADINSGAADSMPRELTDVDGTVYFTADNGIHGRELWRTNGTPEGTVMVADITPGSGSTSFDDFVNVEGQLFFKVGLGRAGEELWTTDGTASGTVRLASTDDYFDNLTAAGELLFFTVDDGVVGNELWASDGTPEGTALAADINSGLAGSNPTSLYAFSGGLFFVANDGEEGSELWSLSTSQTTGTPSLPGDFDNNGVIGFSDFLVVAQSFGKRVENGTGADLDGDGEIGFGDFLYIADNFGQRL